MTRSMNVVLLGAALLAGCSYRPARFADRPPVTRVTDNRPTAVPRRAAFVEAFYLSDVYLRRPIVDALDAERFPDALDVNCRDEVPTSSWFAPIDIAADRFERAYARSGPPRTPVRVERHGSVHRLVDARGKAYELVADIEQRPATLTAAGVIATRLARAVGYRVPEAWLVERARLGLPADTGPPGDRWLAVRWPVGVDLGATDMSRQREDDPNDRIAHRDRRTLRALGMLAAWLDLGELGPTHLRDVYVGRPGRGHVRHYLVHLHDSLGTPALFPAKQRTSAVGVVRGKPLTNFVTLGLAKPRPPARSRETSLRVLAPAGALKHTLADPWEPVDRLLPADGYWMAKRMLAIPDAVIDAAIAHARLPDTTTARHVRTALMQRRRDLVRRSFTLVTPLEVESVSGRDIDLRDLATEAGLAVAEQSRYRVVVLDDAGDEITPPFFVRPELGEVRVTLPELERDYLVVRVTAERNGEASPRAFEIHLVQNQGTPHWVGARH